MKVPSRTKSSKRRVFVIEDHPLMRRSIVEAIEREAIQKMLKPKETAAKAPTGEESGTTTTAKGHEGMRGMAAATNTTNKYICPMPEHVSIEYDRPGKCPICGMTLVPVSHPDVCHRSHANDAVSHPPPRG